MTSPVYVSNSKMVQQFGVLLAFSTGNFLIKKLRSIMKFVGDVIAKKNVPFALKPR